MSKYLLFFLLGGFSLSSLSSPGTLKNLEEKGFGAEEVKESITKIKTLKPEEYLHNIDSFRTSIDRFVRYKRRVCNGEFSSLVLENGETVKGDKKRLTEEEKLFVLELKQIQEDFIKNIFEARQIT